jgi:hypothetical protein
MSDTRKREAMTESEGCGDKVLLNDWHVVALSEDVTPGNLVPVTLLERESRLGNRSQ